MLHHTVLYTIYFYMDGKCLYELQYFLERGSNMQNALTRTKLTYSETLTNGIVNLDPLKEKCPSNQITSR